MFEETSWIRNTCCEVSSVSIVVKQLHCEISEWPNHRTHAKRTKFLDGHPSWSRVDAIWSQVDFIGQMFVVKLPYINQSYNGVIGRKWKAETATSIGLLGRELTGWEFTDVVSNSYKQLCSNHVLVPSGMLLKQQELKLIAFSIMADDATFQASWVRIDLREGFLASSWHLNWCNLLTENKVGLEYLCKIGKAKAILSMFYS